MYGEAVVLARLEGNSATILHKESDHPAADVLREALALGIDFMSSGSTIPSDELELLAPVVNPSKFLGIGLNYHDHARESNTSLPAAPVVFAKTTNAIVGPEQPIVFRAEYSREVDFEAELAVVVGRRGQGITEQEAKTYIFGYTLCNDVSARDAQFSDGQWVRGKGFDTFGPLGPCIVTSDEVSAEQALDLKCSVNGELMQKSSTNEMVFSVSYLVSYISRFMTLEAGDVITTGTPHGVGFARTPPRFLQDGDEVVVESSFIGALRNSVRVFP